MTSAIVIAVLSAFWSGILTSISPCPLATNIAAISFIGKNISRTHVVFLNGLLYTIGRMLAYIIIAFLIITSMLSVPQASYFLQKYINKILGPALILVGMILLEFIKINFSGSGLAEKMHKRLHKGRIWAPVLLGIVFALSFCPISAALFFGTLIPLSLKYNSTLTLPAMYGLGTASPVFFFAVLIAFGAKCVGTVFNKLTQLEWWTRRITGIIFVLFGIYFCLTHIFTIFQ